MCIISDQFTNSSSMMSQKASGGVAELEKSSIGFSNLLYLFDEQWFFYNALNGELAATKKSLHVGPSPRPPPAAVVKIEKTDSSSARQLIIRSPSLPPPRVGCEGSDGQEEEPRQRNYSSSSGPKLRYSYSSKDAPVQQPIPSYSSLKAYDEQSTGKQRAPRTKAPHRCCANPHLLMCWEASNRKAFQNKKWRSLGDLETMELQGFKDLGFVFDETKGLSSSLVRVIPALQGRKEKEEDGGVRRLYLPESWFTQRSAPPMVLRRMGCWSGEEMKEQLRFWARAVACNVRRDC